MAAGAFTRKWAVDALPALGSVARVEGSSVYVPAVGSDGYPPSIVICSGTPRVKIFNSVSSPPSRRCSSASWISASARGFRRCWRASRADPDPWGLICAAPGATDRRTWTNGARCAPLCRLSGPATRVGEIQRGTGAAPVATEGVGQHGETLVFGFRALELREEDSN